MKCGTFGDHKIDPSVAVDDNSIDKMNKLGYTIDYSYQNRTDIFRLKGDDFHGKD